MIYVMRNRKNQEFKIGYTQSVGRRRYDLERESRFQHGPPKKVPWYFNENENNIELLFAVRGDLKVEFAIHKYCRLLRAHGEWYGSEVYLRFIPWCVENVQKYPDTCIHILRNLMVDGIGGVFLKGDVSWRWNAGIERGRPGDIRIVKCDLAESDIRDFVHKLFKVFSPK